MVVSIVDGGIRILHSLSLTVIIAVTRHRIITGDVVQRTQKGKQRRLSVASLVTSKYTLGYLQVF